MKKQVLVLSSLGRNQKLRRNAGRGTEDRHLDDGTEERLTENTTRTRRTPSAEVRVQPAGEVHTMKRGSVWLPLAAVYSVEIKVERDRTTGQTRVLSSQTKLPVDCSRGGVKVYEDEQKVVHEVNGQDGVHLLSAAEVDELILKADQADVTASVDEATESRSGHKFLAASADEAAARSQGAAAFTGPEASPREHCGPREEDGAPREPVTTVSPGYRSVRDRDGTSEILTLQGGAEAEPEPGAAKEREAAAPPPTGAPMPQTDKRESAGGAAVTAPKEKKACKCCSIM
ncbi:paralemmin 1a [Phycodurus eques]|uniref:paralemmin 1a n=1 Tax=Phycodurus eques TaxID=693459 RepID=UPI002ACD35C5|nr:paralemmin 1a [Phycodurus eques]